MTNEQHQDGPGFIRLLRRLINLRADTDRAGTDDLIRANVEFRSANAWTLVFAIFIASIGLNVNSTAVIIGAMLISPLMGPIVGIGFSLGTYDFDLLKRSAKNLAAAILISLLTSMIYFLISPLSEVQSELLARTRPSFYDVLIAFFGGAAGIVAISRKEKGNAIPGVAIATALMPPLCTAGFGLATRNLPYFLGAMYLFVINAVFISIATLIFVRYLKFEGCTGDGVDSDQQRAVNRWITWVAAAVVIPSFFMAWYLQQESFFKSQANKFISQEMNSTDSFVVDRDISFSLKNPRVQVTLLGNAMTPQEIDTLRQKARNYSIDPESVQINQSALTGNLERKMGERLSTAEGLSNQLQMQLKKSETELNAYKDAISLSKNVGDEIAVFFPGKIESLLIFRSSEDPEKTARMPFTILVEWKSSPNAAELRKADEFLKRRLSGQIDKISHSKLLK